MDSENTKQRVIQGKSEIQPNRNKRFNEYSTKQVLGEIKRFYLERDIVNGCQRVNILNELNGKILKVDYNKFMDDFRKAIERRHEELTKKHINLQFVESFTYSDLPCVLVQKIDTKIPDSSQIIRVIEPEELHKFIYDQFEISGLLIDLYI